MKPERSDAVPPSDADVADAVRAVASARAAGDGSRMNVAVIAVGSAAHRSGANLKGHGVASAWLKQGKLLCVHAGKCQLRRAVEFAEAWQQAQKAAEAQLEAAKQQQLCEPRRLRAGAVQASAAWELHDLRPSAEGCPPTDAFPGELPVVWRAAGARPPTGWTTPSAAGGTVLRLCALPVRSSSRAGARSACRAEGAVVGDKRRLDACNHSSAVEGSSSCSAEFAASDAGPPYVKLVAHSARLADALIASAVDHRYGGRWRHVPRAHAQLRPCVPPELHREPAAEVWLSRVPSVSAVHYDQPTSVLLVVAGSKTVYVASPSTRFPKDEITSASGARLKSDATSAPHATWPKNQNGGAWRRVELGAGDALLLPSRWWHQVASTAGAVGLSVPVQWAGAASALSRRPNP